MSALQRVSFETSSHPAFGVLATLRLPAQPVRRFTRAEAAILARALAAALAGGELGRQIYMSPIASDDDFDARVVVDGVVIRLDGHADVLFHWEALSALAGQLRAFAEP